MPLLMHLSYIMSCVYIYVVKVKKSIKKLYSSFRQFDFTRLVKSSFLHPEIFHGI